MKKIKITEAQAEVIYSKLSKKKLKITQSQLEMIKESLGGKAVTNNFKKEAQRGDGLNNLKFEETLINEYGSVELLEFVRSIVETMLTTLNDPTQDGLDRIWRDMGITRGEMFSALADAGLWGYVFFKLPYTDKVKALGRGLKSVLRTLLGPKQAGAAEGVVETDGAGVQLSAEELIPLLDLPATRAEVDWGARKEYRIPSLGAADASTIVHEKEFFTGREFETRKGVKIAEEGYVKDFVKRFGEMPIFSLNGRNIEVLNPTFQQWRGEYNQAKGDTLKKWGSAESTGAPSSGAFVGAFGGSPSDEFNDELSPSNQVADNEEGIITDAVTNTEELKGLEVGTNTEYYRVDGIVDKFVTTEGNTIFMVGLKDKEGELSESHLLFRYNNQNHKVSLMYAVDETHAISAFKAFPEVYHDNLNTISDILVRMATQTDESTSYGGGTSVGAYDAPGFAKGKDGKNLGGGTKQNFDVFGHDGSKVNGGIMEMALNLQHDKETGRLSAVSDEGDAQFNSQDTFMIKDVLKKDGFKWDGRAWSIEDSQFEKAKTTIAKANDKLANDIEKATTSKYRSYGDEETKSARVSKAREKAKEIIGDLKDLEEFVVDNIPDAGQNIKDKINDYVRDLANITDEAALSSEIRRYLSFFTKFHKYTLHNRMLIYIQNPSATHVAGFRTWQSNFSRAVKRGSKPISILAPVMKRIPGQYKKDKAGEYILKKNPKTGKMAKVPLEVFTGRYKGVNVFDIADTYALDEKEGAIPESPKWYGGDDESEIASELVEYLKYAIENMGINVTNDDAKGGERGFSAGGHINLSSDVKGAGEASTLAHEFAHELMHWKTSSPYYQHGDDGDELKKVFTRDTALYELQAESVSYTVLKHYGLPVTHHPTYLVLWKANKDKILANLELISNVATFIIKKVDEMAAKYPNVLQDKGQEVGTGESYIHETIKDALAEVSNIDDTGWPDGRFVDIDDCTKLNNNKEAENGGCNQGDSGVVKTARKSNKSVISNQKGE